MQTSRQSKNDFAQDLNTYHRHNYILTTVHRQEILICVAYVRPHGRSYQGPLYCCLHDEVAEWLRRWTANPLCSARVGSNPILVEGVFCKKATQSRHGGQQNRRAARLELLSFHGHWIGALFLWLISHFGMSVKVASTLVGLEPTTSECLHNHN